VRFWCGRRCATVPLCLIGRAPLDGVVRVQRRQRLSASPLATLAFLNTGTAASTAVAAWALIEWTHRGKPTALGGATAAVAGLVAITPACGNVGSMGAIWTGIGVSVISYAACTFLKPALGYDESLDVFGVHALGGAWARLPRASCRPARSGIETNLQQVMVQLRGIAFVVGFAPVATAVSSSLCNCSSGRCASRRGRARGLDLSEHSESAYGFAGAGAPV